MGLQILTLLKFIPAILSVIGKIRDWVRQAEEAHESGEGETKMAEVVQLVLDYVEEKTGLDVPDKWEPAICKLFGFVIEMVLIDMKDDGDIE
jgi:hypothetical protein